MADPTKFVPGFDYSDFEQSNPTLPKPGAQLDNDFANIKQTTDQTIDALKQIRRSDGALKNGIVTADSLSPGLIIGIETPQAWQTGVTYTPPDAVFISSGVNQGIYRATITHVSTTFAADLAAGKWELIFNLTAAGLSTVALTGEYADLLNKPVLGTAAATDADEYATAAQGVRSDSAVQPEDLADVATSGEYGDLNNKPFTVPAGGATGQTLIKTSGADGAYIWQNPPGGGDMLAALYDPQAIEGDAFDRGNHTGEQGIATITGLADELDLRIEGPAVSVDGRFMVFDGVDGKKAKEASLAAPSLLGRLTAGAGPVEALTQAQARQVLAGWEPIGSAVSLAGIAGFDWINLDAFHMLRLEGCGQVNTGAVTTALYARLSEDNVNFPNNPGDYNMCYFGNEGTTVAGTAETQQTYAPIANPLNTLAAGGTFEFRIFWGNFNKAGRYKVFDAQSIYTREGGGRRMDFTYGYRVATANPQKALRFGAGGGVAFANGLVQLSGIRG